MRFAVSWEWWESIDGFLDEAAVAAVAEWFWVREEGVCTESTRTLFAGAGFFSVSVKDSFNRRGLMNEKGDIVIRNVEEVV